MLKDFTPRLYQQTILGTAAHKNTLVVLPTGLGKTAIALLLAVQRLNHYPQSKILMLAPTKPLCEQHIQTFRKHLELEESKIILFTGEISPQKRENLWKEAQIIVSTPQGLENDVINRRVKLEEVSLLVIDEAHHATGDYPYVWLAKQYDKSSNHTRILALTASPGSDLESIRIVCNNLCIEKVEVRTEKDHDVKEYLQPMEMNWVYVELPKEANTLLTSLKECKKSKLNELQKLGYLKQNEPSKTDLLLMQGELQKEISAGNPEFETLKSISLLAEALKVDHAIELLETQGIRSLHQYLSKMQQEALTSKVKAVKNLMIDPHFRSAIFLCKELVDKNIEHPKLAKLLEILDETMSKNKTAKSIVFTQFRDSAEEILKKITKQGIKGHLFLGQTKKNGLGFSQKQQKEIIEKFKEGEFNVLVATSVAEEGLDIPKVEKVIFFEPVPSAIRSIQRRGRTGRLEEGEVTILVTKGTRDEGYRWSSHHKEKKMHKHLEDLRKNMGSLENKRDEKDQSLASYIKPQENIAILADHREKNNRVVKELIELGVGVKTAQLEGADYIVSGNVAVELKQVPDFVASIIDGRLLEQLRDLKKMFEKIVVVIEGEEDIYSVRKVHANAIRGMLATIVLDFHIPVMYSKNAQDTAGLLFVMAKREQNKTSNFSLHQLKPRSKEHQIEYILASFPAIGLQMARAILGHFGSLQKVFNATEDELSSLPGIGKKTAQVIHSILAQEYTKDEKNN